MKNNGINFNWNNDEFGDLLDSTKNDEAVKLTIKNISNKKIKILEAGSGSGRVVKYLSEIGYKNVHGIEINKEATSFINKKFPKLKIIQGNILNMPYPNEYFDAVISYGVVEHFTNGIEQPLVALRRVLKKGGLAIITVPSQNHIRRIVNYIQILLIKISNPTKYRKRNKVSANGYKYYVYPQFGEFFEYRLTPKQFEKGCRDSGFKVLESIPISHIDGMYHIFGEKIAKFHNWKFSISVLGKVLNKLLKHIPFAHNHMHLCVLKKI